MNSRSRLKLLYVDTDSFWRGGQEQLYSLMVGLASQGHQVNLAAPARSPLSQRVRECGIQTFGYYQWSEFSLAAFSRMYRILKGRGFHVLHLNTPRPLLAGGLASKFLGVPLCISSRRVNFPLRSSLSRLKYNLIQDAVVTVSLSIRETLLEGGVRPELVTVIYEGVDLSWIDEQATTPLFSNQPQVVIGTVAHLSAEKGHMILLKAIAELHSRFPDIRFVLVGTGPLGPRLKSRARELGIDSQIVFTGFRQDSDALMKQFDIFCLPSLSEGLSSAILSAMACRLPVVATRVGGIPELVVDGVTGFLVAPRDSNALCHALSQLITSPELRKRFGESGRARVEQDFTLNKKLRQTEELYRRLLQSRSIK